MKSPSKAKVYYQYAYGMIQVMEKDFPTAANDLLEPLGKYKSEVAKVLNIPVTGFTTNGVEAMENESVPGSLSRGDSKSKLKKQGSMTKDGLGPLKKSHSLRSDKSDEAAMKKSGKCSVM